MGEVRLKSALSILHITDFHIENWLPPSYEKKLEHAVTAAVTVIDSKRLFIVISGDIANSGAAAEYDKANHVLSCLCNAIDRRYEGVVELIIVPGNHDISGPSEVVPRDRGEKARKEQLARMEDFFTFSLCSGVEWENKDVLVVSRSLPDSAGFTGIRFCCLNTAPFSTKTFDKGAHVLSHEALSALGKSSARELSVVVSHHGPDWLDDAPRLELEAEASKSIDLFIAGHEHRGGTLVENRLGKDGLPVFRGGTFSLGDEKECMFTVLNVGPLQMGSYRIDEFRFEWDSTSRMFTSRERLTQRFEIKGLVPRPKREFLQKLPNEISKEDVFFDTSFSFPRLRSRVSLVPEGDDLVTKKPADIESADAFFAYLDEWDCVEIAGSGGSGRSCLARAIYIECIRRGFAPILIHPSNATRSFSRTLDALVAEQYGESPSEMDAFRQVPRDKKVIIADDFDRMKKAKKNEPELLIRQMQELFGKVIITVPSGYDAVSRALIEGDVRKYAECGSLELCRCTKRVRDPLVTKLCQAAGLDAESTGRMVRAVDRAVSGYAGLFELTPAFVTQYVDYFLDHRAEMLSQDELPFKHIFDSNIRRSMLEAAKSLGYERWDAQMVDVAIVALQNVALQMHIKKKSVMDIHETVEAIDAYADSNDVKLKPREVLDVADKARTLIRLEDGLSYMFSSLYIHAYFVARRIDAALDLGEKGAGEQVDSLLDEICFPVNEGIVVFLTQLRLSTEFPEALIARARRLVGSCVPKNLLDPRTHTSLGPLVGMEVAAIDKEKAGRAVAIEDQIENDGRKRFEDIEYADYYDNDIRLLKIPIVRSFMAVKYAELAAGYLVKHFAKMPRDPKRAIREAVFQVPQSAADAVISDIDRHFDEIADGIAGALPDETKGVEDKSVLARRFVAAISLSFYCTFMGSVAAHASEGCVTVDYLLAVDGDAPEYGLGKLFALACAGDSDRFVRSAVAMASQAREDGNHIALIVIKILANQYLRDNTRIGLGNKHRLLNGVFGLPGDSSNARLGLPGR